MSAVLIFDLIAPQFKDSPDKLGFISLAQSRTNACFYGNGADQAIALRAAHMMTLASRTSGDAGAILSKREGDLSVTYAVMAGTGEDLDSTHYGRQLKGLRKGSGAFIGVTGGLDGCGSIL